jgi:hypothetical protein
MKVKLYDRPVCDFCSGQPAWRYPAETFNATPGEPLPLISEDDWVACDECAALIERNEWNALARRGLLTPMGKQAVEMLGEEQVLAMHRGFHKKFRQHRRGRVRAESV